MNQFSDDFISDAELSAMINVPRTTLLLWRQTGQGPVFYQLGPRVARYRLADIDDWLRASQRDSKSDNGRAA